MINKIQLGTHSRREKQSSWNERTYERSIL